MNYIYLSMVNMVHLGPYSVLLAYASSALMFCPLVVVVSSILVSIPHH